MRGVVKYIIMALIAVVIAAVGNQSMAARRGGVQLPDSLSNTYLHTDALKRLVIHRDTSEARRIWHEILERDSTYGPALMYISRTEHTPHEALEYARRAFVADTTNKWYTEHYATKLVEARQYTRAIPIYRRLMRLDPRNLQSYHALAIIYGSSGMPYSAIAILDSAELRMGYNHYLAEIKHSLLLDTRQYERAIAEGKRRSVEMPYDIEARRALAETYDIAGKDSLARVTWEEAFRMDTTNLESIEAIANFYYSKGETQRMFDYEELLFRSGEVTVEEKIHRLGQYTANHNFYAKNYIRIGAIIQRMAIDYPNNREVVNVYAEHMIALGDHDQALELLRRHLDNEATTAEDYIYLLQLERYLGREELVAEDHRRALERFSEDESILTYTAYLHLERGDYKGAIAMYREGLKRATTDEKRSELWGNIGDVYHEMENDKAAFKAYRKALDYNANNILVLNNYAYFLSLKNQELERALEMSYRAMSGEPGNAAYVDTYAWILHLLGRNEEAKTYMRQALTISSQRDASLLCHYGDILWALGEKFMAETYWKKAIERGYDSREMEAHIAEIKANTKQ